MIKTKSPKFSRRSQRMTHSAIRELLKLTEQPDFISFAGGLPAPELLPADAISEASQRVLSGAGSRSSLQYSTTEGFAPLRQWIARRLGARISPDNIIITSGSQQAIDLIGRVFIDDGDKILVESPTYLALLQCWRAYGANYLEVPSDDHGMVTDTLPEIFRQNPKIVYSVPNFQNPRGVTMSLERRQALIKAASKKNIIIVEDDPYRDLRFEGEHVPRLLDLEAERTSAHHGAYEGNVISMGSFSKTLAPGLRVGYVVANSEIIDKLALAKQSLDLHTATFTQHVVYDLVSSGFMEKHLNTIISLYRERRNAMVEMMRKHFPPGVRFTIPEGGMFLWAELPETLNSTEVLQEALAEKVAFVPGSPFHASGGHHNTMRLNFSNSTNEKIEEGIKRLARVFAHHCVVPPQGRRAASPQQAVAAAEAVLDPHREN